MASELRELLDRAERDGWTKGLAYRIARTMTLDHPERMRVCVLCGWGWAGLNRCVNPECGGFCTWGESKRAEPDSWVKTRNGGYRPRMIGERKP